MANEVIATGTLKVSMPAWPLDRFKQTEAKASITTGYIRLTNVVFDMGSHGVMTIPEMVACIRIDGTMIPRISDDGEKYTYFTVDRDSVAPDAVVGVLGRSPAHG